MYFLKIKILDLKRFINNSCYSTIKIFCNFLKACENLKLIDINNIKKKHTEFKMGMQTQNQNHLGLN